MNFEVPIVIWAVVALICIVAIGYLAYLLIKYVIETAAENDIEPFGLHFWLLASGVVIFAVGVANSEKDETNAMLGVAVLLLSALGATFMLYRKTKNLAFSLLYPTGVFLAACGAIFLKVMKSGRPGGLETRTVSTTSASNLMKVSEPRKVDIQTYNGFDWTTVRSTYELGEGSVSRELDSIARTFKKRTRAIDKATGGLIDIRD